MFNMNKMMQQAQELQKELENIYVTGSAGAGAVKVTFNGKGVLTGIDIDSSLYEKQEKDILEDLIIAAHAEAKNQLDNAVQEHMKSLTGGLAIPKGMFSGS